MFNKILEDFLNAQSEQDVFEIIRDVEENNNVIWKPYGGNKGNFSSFENQQSTPEGALIEKIMNSIDHTLIKRCKQLGINESSDDAPASMSDATKMFYSTEEERDQDSILVLVDGGKESPNIIVADKGEGQEPYRFESTFLSLNQGNKNAVRFVQGKFNMGSTGAVVFCGNHKYQLIISKRAEGLERGSDNFGFTIVRKHKRTEEEMNLDTTWYEYMTIEGNIMESNADSIIVSENYEYTSGSIVKMYNYHNLKNKSQAHENLRKSIERLLYEPPFTIKVDEARTEFKVVKDRAERNQRLVNYANGTMHRIEKAIKDGMIEEYGVETLSNPKVFGTAEVKWFVFKASADKLAKDIRDKTSVAFLLNGQAQHTFNTTYVTQELGFKLIKDHTIIIVDCTKFSREFNDEGFFMSNREKIRDNESSRKFLELLKNTLINHEGLIRINKTRASQQVSSEGTKSTFERLFGNTTSTSLFNNLFNTDVSGQKSSSTTDRKPSKDKDILELNKFPTYAKIKGSTSGEKTMIGWEIGKSCKIQIEMDSDNDFFSRTEAPGELTISLKKVREVTGDGEITHSGSEEEISISVVKTELKDGVMTFSLSDQNKILNIGEKVNFEVSIKSDRANFDVVAEIKIEQSSEPVENKKEERKKLNLPPLIQVYESQEIIDGLTISDEEKNGYSTWEKHSWDIEGSNKRILQIIPGTNETELATAIIVNMSSDTLKKIVLEQAKTRKGLAVKITELYVKLVYTQAIFNLSAMKEITKTGIEREEQIIIDSHEDFIVELLAKTIYPSLIVEIATINDELE